MAKTLAGFLHNSDTEVLHARDLGLNKAKDVDWINHLNSTGDDWLVFTGDARIRRNPAEREAYRRAKLKGVVLAAAYQKTSMSRCCGIIVAKWPELIDFTSRIEPPYLVELSINLSPKFKILPI